EVAPLEQQRLAGCPGQRVGEAVAEVELCGMFVALAEVTISRPAQVCLLRSDRLAAPPHQGTVSRRRAAATAGRLLVNVLRSKPWLHQAHAQKPPEQQVVVEPLTERRGCAGSSG